MTSSSNLQTSSMSRPVQNSKVIPEDTLRIYNEAWGAVLRSTFWCHDSVILSHDVSAGRVTDRFSVGIVDRVCHPFQCRLPQDTTFATDDPKSLIGTGYFSIALFIFTAFRITPALLLTLIFRMPLTGGYVDFFPNYGPILIFSWLALMFLTLVVGGVIMACSGRIRKRSVLLFQPWALLLLYFDGFFWLSLTVCLHVGITMSESSGERYYTKEIPYPTAYFAVIYIDIILFGFVHFAFASYYITAQITVIENFF